MNDSIHFEEHQFESQGTQLGAGFWAPARSSSDAQNGNPCIVMAHGLGGTRACGLTPYAEKFAAAGFNVLCFDYRGFGSSDGEPRQVVSVKMQLEDWASAIAYARSLDTIDPRRIALWGSSFSGGLVIAAGVTDGKVAAISSQGAMFDGLAAVLFLIKQDGIAQISRLMRHVFKDAWRSFRNQPREMLPVVGEPGSMAVLTAYDSKSGYLAITPPDWRNEISLDWLLGLAFFRPNKMCKRLPCPTLFCVAEKDTAVPPRAAEDAAKLAGDKGEIKRYPLGHFDIYVNDGFDQSSDDQVEFFVRTLKP
jgi:fermentation-respiration switch protein FrsA (DUF1100 family)